MKLHLNGTANRRISNIEPQNFEGWFRFAQSLFKKKTEYFPSTFDIRHSLLDIRFFEFLFSIKLAALLAGKKTSGI
ncbi:MAG: hypothetical protein JSW26_08770, partial [Desulfobacterales bacterium]